MWTNLCQHAYRQSETEYIAKCNEFSMYPSEGLPYMMIQSFHRNIPMYLEFTKNIFLKPEMKTWIQQFYCKCKRHYLSIKRFILRIVYTRRKSCNTCDLSYTPFTEYSPSLCLSIIDHGKKYTFTHSELYNIIEKSLTNADTYMIANPLPIKNPYTGVNFSKEQLYFLYLNMKHLPLVFRHFIQTNFSIHVFLLENECILRQYQIRKRVQEITKEQIKQEMQDMIVDMCLYLAFTLSSLDTQIVTITQNEKECRDMLTHYYNYLYSLNPYQRQCECRTLINKLKKMYVKPI
jgi:hypothetical protein